MLEQIADQLIDADQAYFAAWKQHQNEPSAASRQALRRAEEQLQVLKQRAEEILA